MVKGMTTIYQLAPDENTLMECYVVKTTNNKIVVIDGGHEVNEEFLPFAIRAILGIKDGEYFEIEGWFLSHCHNDHYGELEKILLNYSRNSNFRIKNFYLDFPDMEKSGFAKTDYNLESLERLKKGFDNYGRENGIDVGKRYYEYINGKIVNEDNIAKGLKISIDNVEFLVLQTWSDEDDQVNGNSMVIKMVVHDELRTKEKSVMFLNDVSLASGLRLLNRYGKELKSDYVQMAHHGQNGASEEVYRAIDGKKRLWPVPLWVWTNEKAYKIGEVRGWFGIDEKGSVNDLVSCLYKKYPANRTKVEDWTKTIENMKIDIEI